MVQKIYTYSKKIAKENKIKTSIALLAFIWIIIMVVSLIPSIALLAVSDKNPTIGVIAIILLFVIEITIYMFQAFEVISPSINGFILLQDGRLYLLTANNNAGAYVATGIAGGHIVKNFTNNSGLGSAVQLTGSAATLYTLEKAGSKMENPEYVYALWNTFREDPYVNLTEISKVNFIEEKKKYYKIKYDAIGLLKGKKYGQQVLKLNKSFKIYKAYTDYPELIGILRYKQQNNR